MDDGKGGRKENLTFTANVQYTQKQIIIVKDSESIHKCQENDFCMLIKLR